MTRTFYLSAAALALTLSACGKSNEDHTSDTLGASGVTSSSEADTMATGTGMESGSGSGTGMASATTDAAFLIDALKGDNAEVAIGKLASAQAMSQKTKDFGMMLATDHAAHRDKVAVMLTSAGGTSTDEVSDDGKANIDKLKALKGAEFDKAFKAAMIEDHQKDIAKYEKQAAGKDAATAGLAKDTLPTLKKHLVAAKAL